MTFRIKTALQISNSQLAISCLINFFERHFDHVLPVSVHRWPQGEQKLVKTDFARTVLIKTLKNFLRFVFVQAVVGYACFELKQV